MSLPSDATIRSRLQRMSHAEFRGLISDLWQREGWETRIDHQSPAHIIASRDSIQGEETEAIQCHSLSNGNKVSVNQVEKHAALPAKAGVETVAIVTTTTFTPSAKSAGEAPYIMLLDCNDVVALLRSNDAGDLLDKYAPPTLLSRVVRALKNRG